MTNVCNECVHSKVCRLKNICERISKKLDDSLDITTYEKESFEVGQFEVKLYCKDFELAVPRTRGIESPDKSLEDVDQFKSLDLVNRGYRNRCEGCPTYEMLRNGKVYVGDLPCQWCDKNPMRVTCSSTTTTESDHINMKITDNPKDFTCGDCAEAFRNGVPCPDIDGYCHYKKRGK